jgi:phosphotriesterase-related protein
MPGHCFKRWREASGHSKMSYNSRAMTNHLPRPLTRRQAINVLSMGAAAAALSVNAFAQEPSFPKGAIIRAILKDYAPGELAGGATLFHEHMQLGPDFNAKFSAATAAVRAAQGLPAAAARGGGGARGGVTPPAAPDPARVLELKVADVAEAKRDGIACIVDAGHPDMGRDINFLRQVSSKSGMPIVAGGGFYAQPWYTKEVSTMSEDQLVRALVKQADDDCLGAFGEIGSWDEMTVDERKVFRAIGKAHLATNLPIFTHTGIPGKAAIEQLNILEDAGVNPAHVIIGHLGNLVDANLYVHKTLCRRGAFVGFDRQGGNNDAQQVPLVMGLLEAGFADNLMFSADTSSGYAKTVTVFLPKLKAAGADEKVLQRIMVDNPRRFLAFVPKRSRKG